MKTFWKLLGAATLVAGLTPYKVEKNEETGENSYQALLYRLTSVRGETEKDVEIGINLGEGTLTSKLADIIEKKEEEPHLFSDELCVEYTGAPVTVEEPESPAEEKADAADGKAEAEIEAAEEETAAADTEAQNPAEENKEEA